ncbi:hypothetical protein M405DRAFT_582420 [Rhizopogon salebrosus TDB-379]|nr:hypothetical protein M405DRAFT_582420 [Rhizopogon salebrosus TDB-379]
MRIHMLQCECLWRRIRQLHQAMNHTLGTDSFGGEMRLWSRNSIGYKVWEYPPRLYHCSPCCDIDDWTVLSICVASLRLFPYHHTYTLRPLLSVLRYRSPDCIIQLCYFSGIFPYHHSTASAPNSTSFAIITFFCCHHISQFPHANDVMRGSASNCGTWLHMWASTLHSMAFICTRRYSESAGWCYII